METGKSAPLPLASCSSEVERKVMANPFEGLKTARPSINRYIRSGHYLARIDAVKLAKNRTDGDIFAIEMTNVYTFPDGEQPKGGQPFHSVGEAFSEVISRAG